MYAISALNSSTAAAVSICLVLLALLLLPLLLLLLTNEDSELGPAVSCMPAAAMSWRASMLTSSCKQTRQKIVQKW